MICNENSLVMDIGLLANVSRELKDRICADTFQKLQVIFYSRVTLFLETNQPRAVHCRL